MSPKFVSRKRNYKQIQDNADTAIATTTTNNTSTTTAHPRKRQKTQPKGSAKRAPKQSLSVLPDMPIDILFEIFSNLTPLDLLNLSRTTKALRRLLLDRKSVTVWSAARRRTCPRWPDLPADIAEPFWANLLFGKPVCDECGKKNTHKIVFELRRRLCFDCLLDNTITIAQSYNFLAFSCPSALHLLPIVLLQGGKRYWESDMDKLLTVLDSLKSDVHKGKPGAEKALADFKQEHKTNVKAILDHAKRCNDAFSQDEQEMATAQYEEMMKRFMALGFEEQDVKNLLSRRPRLTTPLSDREFNRLREELEPRLVEIREGRLEKQYRNIRQARRQIVSELYRKYCNSLSPLEQDYMPDLRSVYGFPDVLALVNSDHTLQITRKDFAEMVEKLPAAIRQWDAELEEKLKNIETARAALMNSSAPRLRRMSDLNLAVFVVECSSWAHAFGKREVLAHAMHNVHGHTVEPPCDLDLVNMRFSEAGSAAVLSLIKMLKIHESEATPEELDKRDARFLCLQCHDHSPECGGYRWIMNWRQAVVHFVNSQTGGARKPHAHANPRWGHIVSDRRVRAIRKAEQEDSRGPAPWVWRCNLCTALDRKSKLHILKHIREWHGVTKPAIGRDYFTDAGNVNLQKPVHRLLDDGDEFSDEVRIWSSHYADNWP